MHLMNGRRRCLATLGFLGVLIVLICLAINELHWLAITSLIYLGITASSCLVFEHLLQKVLIVGLVFFIGDCVDLL